MHFGLSMGVAVGLGKMNIPSVEKSCLGHSGVLQNQDTTGYSSGLHQYITEVSEGYGWLGEFSISHNNSLRYVDWQIIVKKLPDVVSYSLRPLYQLVPSMLQKAGLKAAIEQYLEDTAVKNSPQEPHCGGSSNCCPVHASRGFLEVTIVRAWNLFGEDFGLTDGYAKMFYGSIYHKTKMIQSNDPWWNAQFNLGKVDTSLALKIEVWDEDPKYDDLLVKCEKYLSQGTHTFMCKGPYGNVEVKYMLLCDRFLTGEKCSHYKPSPL